MASVIRIVAVVMMAVIPGGLLVLSAFVMARVVAAKVKDQPGPHRFTQAVAKMTVRDVWNETRSLL